MTAPSRSGALGALLLALALGACGPYGQLAQKLDVTDRLAGDTWIAAGPDRNETRMIVLGDPDARGSAGFSFSSIAGPIVTTRQGSWTEWDPAGATSVFEPTGVATLHVRYTYSLDQNAGVSGSGSTRDENPYTLQLSVQRQADQLVVSGDAGMAGTYVHLQHALLSLGTSTPQDLTCAFQLMDVAVQTSEARIIGFGSGRMVMYRQAADFQGTIAGKVNVNVSLGLGGSATTFITYSGFSDQGGVAIDGTQRTDAGLSGTGSMSDTVRFAFTPASPDPSTVATTIRGAIDYGNVSISGGIASGGDYVVSIDPVGTATTATTGRVPVLAFGNLSPSVADCLALP